MLVTTLRVTVSFLLCLFVALILFFCMFFYVLELFNGNELKSISVDFSVGGSTDC